jgi:hypothetical protein
MTAVSVSTRSAQFDLDVAGDDPARDHRHGHRLVEPSATWLKAIHDSAAETISSVVVMISRARADADGRTGRRSGSPEAGGRRWRRTLSAQPFIMLMSSTAIEPRLRK